MITAQIEINDELCSSMDTHTLEKHVSDILAQNIARKVVQHKSFVISEQHHLNQNTITYTGTLDIPAPARVGYVQNKLRVIEYTKNGKVTRVELQEYDAEQGVWRKIPRLQIEEK